MCCEYSYTNMFRQNGVQVPPLHRKFGYMRSTLETSSRMIKYEKQLCDNYANALNYLRYIIEIKTIMQQQCEVNKYCEHDHFINKKKYVTMRIKNTH